MENCQQKYAINTILALALWSPIAVWSVGEGETEPAATAPVPNVSFVKQFKLVGQLYERGTRVPLRDIAVYLLPQKIKAVTNAQGEFSFDGASREKLQIVINQSGYKRMELNLDARREDSGEEAGNSGSNSTTPVADGIRPPPTGADSSRDLTGENDVESLGRIYLEKITYSPFETTILGDPVKRDVVTRTLTQKQFLTLPGSGGDPVKAVQNLPGVNRVQGFSSQVVIQGSSPQDTVYALNGHEIPLAFHFGGLTSVVMPEAIEEVDYLSAGYGPQFSRAMGGIINLRTRDPDLQGRKGKGFFFADNLKAGGLIERQIDEKSSFLISGRYSYIGYFLRAVLENNSQLNLTVVPQFSDLNGIYKYKLSERDELRLTGLASSDSLGFLFKEPLRGDPGIRGNFANETIFWRLIPSWKRIWGGGRESDMSVAFGNSAFNVDIGEKYFHLKNYSTTVRGQWIEPINTTYLKDWKTITGIDNSYYQAKVSVKLPVPNNDGGIFNPAAGSEIRETEVVGKGYNLGIFHRHELELAETPLRLIPGVRFDYFSLTKQSFASPRLATRYRLTESIALKVAYGLYYQPPEFQQIDKTFGNPDVKAPSAVHATLGIEKTWDSGYSLSVGVFDKKFRNLVVSSSNYVVRDGLRTAEIFNNKGEGLAQGLETQFKWDDGRFSGWVTYTLSKSTRQEPAHREYVYEYDQTHNINVVGAWEFERNWKLSGRYRYVTGNPITPVKSAIFDADNDVYIPSRGEIFSERLEPFQQLDVRFDKKLILDEEIWSFYLDIQNVTNQMNPESVQFAYDYSSRTTVSGLPFLPALGLKGEF